ncbi:L-serine ammonia-lyase [Compostimonas suwonensis]|uniref:L-serine dehydratase n=1 Tax=Compostimonas suwonensis TaxID=1048394 RepID=A0A2M9BVZ7_9MICO|nr:L-serine ammonia-lyase [Compostimonas suwonensis]PJJ62120.1 L-serine dehydratase [Compostimonas suwonensis]
MTAYVSALDLFSIGIGPSSSHTVGPMRAARAFVTSLAEAGDLERVSRIHCSLYGSLGSTGLGHGTPDAVVAGLMGMRPESCDPHAVRGAWSRLETGGVVRLAGRHPIELDRDDVTLEPRTRLPGHPNALTLAAWAEGDALPFVEQTYYSVGGGFIRRDGDGGGESGRETRADVRADAAASVIAHPYPFATAEALIALCDSTGLAIDELARANELSSRTEEALDAGLDAIWAAMAECTRNGLGEHGELPGGLHVKRRAAAVRERLREADDAGARDTSIEWLHAFALAVNEENAAGGRVVTAPTNGAAGIVPAVGHYYLRFVPGASADGIRRYLLTATAIGSLVKANASISGAEAGCQGEVGTACAMAAGGLCAVLGGTPAQVENAAEIAMEHHLGLTCDPVAGLVQIPCIERNAIASSTAVSAARLALHGDGTHLVSLDTVIETMRQTGFDMSTKYKETSEGGLAVNVVEC